MKIEIRKDVFENNDRLKITTLYYSLIKGRRYEVFIDFTQLIDNSVFQSFHEEDKDLIKEAYIDFMSASKTPDCFISNETQDFNIDEAHRYFDQKVLVILENDLNDSYFIDALLLNFKTAGRRIKKCKDEGWLEYSHAGGATDVKNRIVLKARSFDALPKENYKYLRCIVILDSDRKYKNMPLDHDKRLIEDFLVEKNIPYHILEKREMENYIPEEAINDLAVEKSNEYLKTYVKLSPEQKDYFDIEKGFCDKNHNNLSPEVQNLYQDDEGYKILRKGLDRNFFSSGTIKSEFPKLFEHPKVNQETLLKRTKHQKNKEELKEILSKISRLL